MSEIESFLKRIEMFIGLSDEQLKKVANFCQEVQTEETRIIIERNDPADSFYLIQEGTVEILTAGTEASDDADPSIVVTLGKGQCVGEMALVDSGNRSASVRAATGTTLFKVDCGAFRNLCETDTDLGYKVMRNIATDLSFKLRYRNLIQV